MFAVAIGWTNTLSTLKDAKLDGRKFPLQDAEQIVDMIFYRERLYVATNRRLLKLRLSEPRLAVEAQKDLPVCSMFAVKNRLLLRLSNRSLKEVDVDLFEPAGKSHVEKYRCVCANGALAYFVTEAGVVVSDSATELPELIPEADIIDCMHCVEDGSLFAAIGNDVFALGKGARKWKRFINPARTSFSGHWTFSSISGWHAELPMLVVAAHSKAPELVVFGLKSADIVQFILMTEDALPQYPLSSIDPDADCCPVSMAFGFTDGTRLQPADPNDPPLPPVPLLWTLTTDGTLVPFRVVRRGREESQMLHLMRPIESKGALLAAQASAGGKHRPKLQVSEEIPLDVAKQQRPNVSTPVTVDLGGFKNLLVADFMKIYELIESDLQRLADVNAENQDLVRQIEEEAVRLLHIKSISEPTKFIEDDHRVAEELSTVGENQMERMLVLIKALSQKQQRLRHLQRTIRRSPITALEEQIESMHICDVRRMKSLSASASIDEIMEKIKQLDIAADHLSSIIPTPGASPFAPADGDGARESRERMKAVLAGRSARFTRIKEAPKLARPPPPPPATTLSSAPLSVMHKVIAERNTAALQEMQRLPVVESSATPDVKDSVIFCVIESETSVKPSEKQSDEGFTPKADTPTTAASSLTFTDVGKSPLLEKVTPSTSLKESSPFASGPSPLAATKPESMLKFPKAFQLSFGSSSSTEEAGDTVSLVNDKGKSPLSTDERSEKSGASSIAGLAALLAKAPSATPASARESTEAATSPPKSPPLFSARSVAFGKSAEQLGDGGSKQAGTTFNFGFTTTSEESSPFRPSVSEKEDSASAEPKKADETEAPKSVEEEQPIGAKKAEVGFAIERDTAGTEQTRHLQAEAEQVPALFTPTKQQTLQSPPSEEKGDEEQPLEVSSEALQQTPGNEEPENDLLGVAERTPGEENNKISKARVVEATASGHVEGAPIEAEALPLQSVDLKEYAQEDRQAIETLASAALAGLDSHQAESLSVISAPSSAIKGEHAASNGSMEQASTLQTASNVPSELSFSLGRSLADIERQAEVRTIFGVSAAVVESKHPSALLAPQSPFAPPSSPSLQHQMAAQPSPPSFGQSAFGQRGQATFARPAFGQPSFGQATSFASQQPQQFGQPSFGQQSQLGQPPFGNLQQQNPFSMQPTGQPSGFSTYASKGTTTFFGTLSSQQTHSVKQESPKKDEQLPPSFSGFRE